MLRITNELKQQIKVLRAEHKRENEECDLKRSIEEALYHVKEQKNDGLCVTIMNYYLPIYQWLLFEVVESRYVGPLSRLVHVAKCNIHMAKMILWYLYPANHMGDDVSTICKALEDRVFTRDQGVVLKKVKM